MLNSNKITKWKSKGLFNESLEVISTSGNTLTPSINYYGDKAKQMTNALLGAVELTKNANIDKYKYSGYGIRLDGRGFYSHPSVELEEM